MRRAVFVDRDNTLIDNHGYLADPEAVRLLPGAAAAVARLRSAGYRVVVVTNQSGVARGLVTEDQLAAVHQRMQDLLRSEGTGVDAVYYCPYLDTEEAVVPAYRRNSDLRKPRPGMLLLAAREMGLSLPECWMIGDAERDIEAGRAAGCRTIRIHLQAGERSLADMTARDLAEAADRILSFPSDDAEEPARMTPTMQESGAESRGDARTTLPDAAGSQRPALSDPGGVLPQILDELRTARLEAQRRDFSLATLVGAVTQAFAVCALGWGLWAAMDVSGKNPGAVNDAVMRLLAAIVFQLMALTAFVAGRR